SDQCQLFINHLPAMGDSTNTKILKYLRRIRKKRPTDSVVAKTNYSWLPDSRKTGSCGRRWLWLEMRSVAGACSDRKASPTWGTGFDGDRPIASILFSVGRDIRDGVLITNILGNSFTNRHCFLQ